MKYNDKQHSSYHRNQPYWVSLLMLLSLTISPAIAAEPLILASGTWPPFYSPQMVHGGLGGRICTAAFAQEGIEVSYEYMPWKRVYDLTKAGHYAGTAGWVKLPDRKKHFFFSDPFLFGETVFFHRKDIPFEWDSLKDISEMRVGVSLGYSYETTLAPYFTDGNGQLETAPTDLLNFQKLLAGRIDLFPCSSIVGSSILKKHFSPEDIAKVTYHPKPLYIVEQHFIAPKSLPGSKDLIDNFNRGLKKLKENGLYDQYLAEALDNTPTDGE